MVRVVMMMMMMTVTSYAWPTQKKGKKREKKKEKEKEGREEEEETAKLHRAGVNLTTYCLPPTAGAYRCLLPTTGATAAYCCLPPAACRLPLAPTAAYRWRLRVLPTTRSASARVRRVRH